MVEVHGLYSGKIDTTNLKYIVNASEASEFAADAWSFPHLRRIRFHLWRRVHGPCSRTSLPDASPNFCILDVQQLARSPDACAAALRRCGLASKFPDADGERRVAHELAAHARAAAPKRRAWCCGGDAEDESVVARRLRDGLALPELNRALPRGLTACFVALGGFQAVVLEADPEGPRWTGLSPAESFHPRPVDATESAALSALGAAARGELGAKRLRERLRDVAAFYNAALARGALYDE